MHDIAWALGSFSWRHLSGNIDEGINDVEQPIGPPLPNWVPPSHPLRKAMRGRFCSVEPIDERFADELYEATASDVEGRNWTYLPYGPFTSAKDYRLWLVTTCLRPDPMFYAVVDRATGRAVGVAAYLRIEPQMGTIEVGHIHFSPLLQRTPAATEAMYLMMRNAFALGYRRYEWKCDALNAPSRAAALRLGFSFEGIFRQATVYKGRNRDTAWYAVIDREWPLLARAFEAWLAPANFDEAGQQRRSLRDLTKLLITNQE